MEYPMPQGLHAIPRDQLDLRPDADIDHAILHPQPVRDEKNIWFYWHTGYHSMHNYTKRNVRTWHRRFSKQGWVVRVLDRQEGSPLNVSNYLDVTDARVFPKAFADRTLTGQYAAQHNSDLVRLPLLLEYGGVYADVGLIQIGDLDRLWNETVGDAQSPIEVMSYAMKASQVPTLTNYFLASHRANPFFERALLKDVPTMSGVGLAFEEDGTKYTDEEVGKMLTDYIIQGQAISMVMGLIDDENGWSGPEYVPKHVWTTDYIVGSQLINRYTACNGPRAFELMSLSLPKEGETESADQQAAREIVENCLSRSFGFKLATGLIVRVMGDTLSSLWRKHDGSDDVEGTYAHRFRHGTLYWCPDELPPRTQTVLAEPWKRGSLSRER